MEYALWGMLFERSSAGLLSLNPYSNGICSMSAEDTYTQDLFKTS